jgi:ATP-binding cassette subfamily B protein
VTSLTSIQCLAAVARHHGLTIPAERIVHENNLGTEEPSPKAMLRIAEGIHLKSRVATLGWADLFDLDGVFPLMVRTRDGRYAIVAGLVRGGEGGEEPRAVALLNPAVSASGVQQCERQAFEALWSGEVIFLKRDYRLTDEDQPFGLRWFIPEILKQRNLFRDIAVATMVINLVMLAIPMYTQLVVDKVLVHENASTLVVITVGVLFAILFEGVFTYIRQYLLLSATNKIDVRLSRRVFAHLLSLPIDYFERQTAGLIARHVQQIQSIQHFLTGSMFFTLLEMVSFFIFLPVLFGYSFKLTLIVLMISALMAAVVLLLIKPFSTRLEKLSGAESLRQGMLIESIHGMRTIKSLALEPKQRKVWEQRTANSIHLHFDVMGISLTAQALTQALNKLMTVAIVVFGALEIFDRNLTVGSLIAFQMLSGRVVGPLVQFVGLIHEYQQTAISVKMLADVMNHPKERKSNAGLRPQIQGRIGFDHVTFRYPGSSVSALDNIHLDIAPGEVVGVVGRSGSGKSTFAKLLQGLYTLQAGVIRLDGSDIREIDLAYMRQNIGVVLQDNFMFKGSVRENIAMTKSSATFEEVVEAAKAAGADEFIERMPNGFETLLEEGASNLSGGQKQRLAIARALLPKPRILILDEAASALDPESEAIFMNNLSEISKGKTVVIISHRLSTLVKADKILFFEHGKILDAAPHAQLLARCAPYAHLWHQQNGHL